MSIQIEEKLTPNENWQTQQRGSHEAEYEIYKQCAADLGWTIKSFDEWMAS